jgi:TRAP-type C4-dicarboxylate transport system permease small subunit
MAHPSWTLLGSFYERLEQTLLVAAVAGMVCLGFVQILFRNLISVGTIWVDPLLRHLVLWIALLGASTAIRENRHIRIDVLLPYLSPPLQRHIRGGIEFFSAAICFLLVSPAIRFLKIDYQAGKILALGIPLWVSQAVLPVMMLVLAIRFLRQGWNTLSSAGRG